MEKKDTLYAPIQSAKVFERVAEQIERRILDGELHVGDRLPTERQLAEQFRVSRTAVREAMKILAQKGLVDMRPGRGTIVIDGARTAAENSISLLMKIGESNPSKDLLEVRGILEPEIAYLAALRATEADLDALREAMRVMDENLHNADAFIEADNTFHEALAAATQNKLILTLLKSIVNLLSEQRKRVFNVEGGPQRGQTHHMSIYQSVIKRDAPGASKAMSAHLYQVRQDIRE